MWGLLFRMPWWAYFALGPLLLIGAGYAYYDYQQEVAAKSATAKHAPPAPVPVESIDPTRATGKVNEVIALAQVDLEHAVELTESKRGVERHHWTVVPIYPTNVSDPAAPAIGAMVHDGAVEDNQLASLVAGRGSLGPVMKLDGIVTNDFSTTQAVTKALAGRVKLPENPIIIDTFVAGRQAGLKPDEGGFYVAIAAAIAGLAAIGYGFYRRASRGTAG